MSFFLPFYPPNSPKKEKKTPGDIIILQNCTKNHSHMLNCSRDMVRDGCNCYFSFWAIFCYFTTLTGRKINIWKKKRKNARRYHHFTHGYQKLWSNDLRFLRYGVWQTDGQMDGQMDGRSDIQRWVPQLSMKDC